MSAAIGTIEHKCGESIVFGLRAADPEFSGAELVTCDVKRAVNGSMVPDAGEPAVLSIVPQFVAGAGAVEAYWRFTISAAQSALLGVGTYITDARIDFGGGVVDKPDPIAIALGPSVTP